MQWSADRGHSCEVRLFSSVEVFWFAFQDDSTCDIALLDVEMGKHSGIDLAKKLRAYGSNTEILFITSHFEFVSEGYIVLFGRHRRNIIQILKKDCMRASVIALMQSFFIDKTQSPLGYFVPESVPIPPVHQFAPSLAWEAGSG